MKIPIICIKIILESLSLSQNKCSLLYAPTILCPLLYENAHSIKDSMWMAFTLPTSLQLSLTSPHLPHSSVCLLLLPGGKRFSLSAHVRRAWQCGCSLSLPTEGRRNKSIVHGRAVCDHRKGKSQYRVTSIFRGGK